MRRFLSLVRTRREACQCEVDDRKTARVARGGIVRAVQHHRRLVLARKARAEVSTLLARATITISSSRSSSISSRDAWVECRDAAEPSGAGRPAPRHRVVHAAELAQQRHRVEHLQKSSHLFSLDFSNVCTEPVLVS